MSATNAATMRRVLLARGLRAFGDGYVSLLLPVYLITLGLSPFQVGVIATGTLLGSAALSLLVGLRAHRIGYRTLLIAAAGLMAATGFAFSAASERRCSRATASPARSPPRREHCSPRCPISP